MKSYNIHLIRHGAVEETMQGRYIGTTDVPLSDKGKADLRKLDHFCKYPYCTALFTSPLKRCKETCEILYPNLKPIVLDGFIECSFGEWEGLTAEDLKGDEDFEKWLAGSSEVKPPKGESGADFTRRVCRLFEDVVNGLMKTGTTDCVIVAHAGVISTILAVYGLPQAKPFEWQMDPGCGYSMRITPLLWQRDKVAEVFETVPREPEDEEN